jgi:predicted permease
MTDSAVILHRVALNAAFIAVGYALRALKILTLEDGKTVFRFATNVTLPALLLYVMTRASAVGASSGLSATVSTVSAIIPACSLLVGVGCSFGAYLAYRKSPARARGLAVGSATGVNLGMFAYPFVEAIWGVPGLALCAMWDAPNAVVVFGAAKAIFAAEQKHGDASRAVHDDGGIYDGEWLDKKKHGYGCYKYPSGATYEGQWKNNVKDGLGVYTYGKGGSYAGEFKRGRFDGTGIRVLRTGAVKAGLWEDNEFVEATTVKDCEGTIAATNAAVSTARKAAEASNLTMKDLFWKVAKFPPVIAVTLASMMNFTGIALPQTASQLVVPLANANNPIVLLTLGVLFKPAMDRMQVQAVAKFIGVKYGLGLLSAAVCTLFIPQSFALARGVIAALCVMPVPSIVMQYSAEHENDGQLAAAIVLSSQAMTLVLICCFAVVAPYIVSIDKVVFSGALLAGAVAVGVASAVSVRALKPSRVDKAKSQGVAVAPTASMRSTSPRNIAHRRQRRDVTVNIAVNAPLRALTARGSSFTSAKRSAPQAPLRAALSGGVKLVGL